MSDVYGPLVSRGDVERAVLAVLQTPPPGSQFPLLVYYLAARERLTGTPPRTLPPPPSPDSFRGGLDFNAYNEDLCPMVQVVCQPDGKPERQGDSTYSQDFKVQVAATVIAADEASTRALADEYGAAIMAMILQHGSLNQFSTRTKLTGFPETVFLDPTKRRLQRSTVTFSTYVDQVAGERFGPGPLTPLTPDPYAVPGVLPTVETVTVTLTAVPVGDPL